MVTRRPPGDGNAGADQRVLRSMLKRSGYATSDLKASEGPDHAREHLMIGHINDGMIMGETYPLSKRQISQRRIAASQGPALSRWEDDGGSFADRDTARTAKTGNDDGEI